MAEDTPYQKRILLALQGKPGIYTGTVAGLTVSRRRAKGRKARSSRRTNR